MAVRIRRTRIWINQGLANVHWWFTNIERGFGLTKDLQMFTILLFLLFKCKLTTAASQLSDAVLD